MMGVVEHAAVSDVSMGDSQKVPSAAFEAFYVAELPGQVRRAYLLVGSDEAANDIVHEAMVSHPGSDGGSGYWFPTPVGVGCWAA